MRHFWTTVHDKLHYFARAASRTIGRIAKRVCSQESSTLIAGQSAAVWGEACLHRRWTQKAWTRSQLISKGWRDNNREPREPFCKSLKILVDSRPPRKRSICSNVPIFSHIPLTWPCEQPGLWNPLGRMESTIDGIDNRWNQHKNETRGATGTHTHTLIKRVIDVLMIWICIKMSLSSPCGFLSVRPGRRRLIMYRTCEPETAWVEQLENSDLEQVHG